jgi:hypothetical protein
MNRKIIVCARHTRFTLTMILGLYIFLFLSATVWGQAYCETECGIYPLGDVYGKSYTFQPWFSYVLQADSALMNPMFWTVDSDSQYAVGSYVEANTYFYPNMSGTWYAFGEHYRYYNWPLDPEHVGSSSCTVNLPDFQPPTGEDIQFSGWSESGGLYADSYATLTPRSSIDYENWTIYDLLSYQRDTCYENYPTGPRADPGAGIWYVSNGAYGPDPIGSSSDWLGVYAPMVASGSLQACGWAYVQDMYYDRGYGQMFFASHTIGQSLSGTTATSTRGTATASHSTQGYL